MDFVIGEPGVGKTAVVEGLAQRIVRGDVPDGLKAVSYTHLDVYKRQPMETAVIVSAFTDDEEIIAAALLHDVMEDAGVTREELEDKFGSRVADLVVDESEDKSRSWQERKTRTVRHLCTASRDIKILALGDKLSNCLLYTSRCV